MKFLFAFVLCLALLSSAFADIWSNCGTSADLLTINSVDITPNPPQKGQQLTISASGILSETIYNGTATITVKYGFLPLYKGTQDICQAKDPMQCPIPAGEYNKNVSVVIPATVPSGKYSGSLVLKTSQGQEIACVDVAFAL